MTNMKKILTCLLATLGLTTACGLQNFENTDVQGFAELIADTNVVVLDVRTAAEFVLTAFFLCSCFSLCYDSSSAI